MILPLPRRLSIPRSDRKLHHELELHDQVTGRLKDFVRVSTSAVRTAIAKCSLVRASGVLRRCVNNRLELSVPCCESLPTALPVCVSCPSRVNYGNPRRFPLNIDLQPSRADFSTSVAHQFALSSDSAPNLY
jgi:hypothetical protein